jgi:threonine synthase
MPWPRDNKPMRPQPLNAMQQFRDPAPPQGNAMARALMGKPTYGPATGMRVPGNMDMALSARPQVRNPDGSVSTVRTVSFGTDEGEVVVPTVSDDGRIMSDEEAIQNYYRTGKHMGIFSDPDSATAYAKMLHEGHEWLMGKNK